jgi:hypothetical protein
MNAAVIDTCIHLCLKNSGKQIISGTQHKFDDKGGEEHSSDLAV